MLLYRHQDDLDLRLPLHHRKVQLYRIVILHTWNVSYTSTVFSVWCHLTCDYHWNWSYYYQYHHHHHLVDGTGTSEGSHEIFEDDHSFDVH